MLPKLRRDDLGNRPKISESEIPKVKPKSVLESGPEWRRLGRHGSRHVGAEIVREARDLEAWGGR